MRPPSSVGIKLATVARAALGTSGRAMLEALVQGTSTPRCWLSCAAPHAGQTPGLAAGSRRPTSALFTPFSRPRSWLISTISKRRWPRRASGSRRSWRPSRTRCADSIPVPPRWTPENRPVVDGAASGGSISGASIPHRLQWSRKPVRRRRLVRDAHGAHERSAGGRARDRGSRARSPHDGTAVTVTSSHNGVRLKSKSMPDGSSTVVVTSPTEGATERGSATVTTNVSAASGCAERGIGTVLLGHERRGHGSASTRRDRARPERPGRGASRTNGHRCPRVAPGHHHR